MKFFTDVLISFGTFMDRDAEELKKALEGTVKFFPVIKIKPEQELCFQSLVGGHVLRIADSTKALA